MADTTTMAHEEFKSYHIILSVGNDGKYFSAVPEDDMPALLFDAISDAVRKANKEFHDKYKFKE